MTNHYVIVAPTVVGDIATWSPFADDTGIGYRGETVDGQEVVVMLRPANDGLYLVVDDVHVETYRVGG